MLGLGWIEIKKISTDLSEQFRLLPIVFWLWSMPPSIIYLLYIYFVDYYTFSGNCQIPFLSSFFFPPEDDLAVIRNLFFISSFYMFLCNLALTPSLPPVQIRYHNLNFKATFKKSSYLKGLGRGLNDFVFPFKLDIWVYF